jgi:hypothetical protein
MTAGSIPRPRTNRPSAIERLERVSGPLLGRAIHAVLTELLSAGVRSIDAEQLFSIVAAHPIVRAEAVADRHAFKQRVITGVASYFRFFLPDPAWTLLGCELRAGRCPFDLVWKTPEGRIVIDEIKAGRLQTKPEREAVEGQLARQLTAAQHKWHSHFSGIRLLWIGAPLHSVFVRPDGVRVPIWEVE